MKKIIYILGLSFGMGLSQSATAFCCFGTQTQTQTRNRVVRMIRGTEVIYKFACPHGTIQARNRNGVCTGFIATKPSCLCFGSYREELSQLEAEQWYGICAQRFNGIPFMVILVPTS